MKLGDIELFLLATTAIFSLVGGLLLHSIVSKRIPVILRSKNIADVSTFSKLNVVQINAGTILFSSIGCSSKCCSHKIINFFIHFKESTESDALRAKLKGTSLILVGMMGSGKSTVGLKHAN